jgi:small membrane protein
VTFASYLLLGLVAGLVVYDFTQLRGKNRRVLVLEVLVYVVGAFFIAFPDRATALAHLVGIGRGVDFLLYPIVIWLVRESLLSRRQRLFDEERLTELTRRVALLTAEAQERPQRATSE